MEIDLFAPSWGRIVPGVVATATIVVGIGPASVGEDVVCQLVEIVVCVGVVESFGETIDKDPWIWSLDIYFWVGAITMVNGEEDVAGWCIPLGSAGFGEGAVVGDEGFAIIADD